MVRAAAHGAGRASGSAKRPVHVTHDLGESLLVFRRELLDRCTGCEVFTDHVDMVTQNHYGFLIQPGADLIHAASVLPVIL